MYLLYSMASRLIWVRHFQAQRSLYKITFKPCLNERSMNKKFLSFNRFFFHESWLCFGLNRLILHLVIWAVSCCFQPSRKTKWSNTVWSFRFENRSATYRLLKACTRSTDLICQAESQENYCRWILFIQTTLWITIKSWLYSKGLS